MSAASNDPRNYIDQTEFHRLETRIISAPTTFMRREPSPSAAAETQLIFGEYFHVHDIGPETMHETEEGWLWGQSESLLPGASFPGYVGWVKCSDLAQRLSIPTHKVTAISAPVFAKSDIKSPVQKCLPLNSLVTGQMDEGFLKIDQGYIHRHHVSELAATSRHADWVSIAESLMGQPYIWGGVSSFGLDCSGLVQSSLRAFGQDAPRDSDQQSQMGEGVAINDRFTGLQRGDLIFWKGHVGIMTSPTRLLHANAHHMMVAAEPVVTAAARIAKSAGAVMGVRRLSA